jgi:glycosyltransferase involved in cell wall biosynthesis
MRYLGISQGQCRGIHKLLRGALVLLCRCLGRDRVVKLLLPLEKKLPEEYDCAIAFLHNGTIGSFYGGVQEFTLSRVKAKQKAAFLHCDYETSGANHPRNNRILSRFDRIAACSDGCRQAFLRVMPEMDGKCVTVRNFHPYDQIRTLAAEQKVSFEKEKLHGLMVARLAHEKGIERGILAVQQAKNAGFDMVLHLVGSGGMEQQLRQLVGQLGLEEAVRFHGEQVNPYPYMAAADLFLLTSYHEAAPMVIDEAVCLGLPVLTVRTTSSHDMVTQREAGWVCDNDQQALNEALLEILRHPDRLDNVKTCLKKQTVDNSAAAQQLHALIEE